MKGTPPEESGKRGLNDHFWRAGLRGLPPDEVRTQLLQAMQDGDDWRFGILTQLELEASHAEDYLQAAVENGRMDMLDQLLQRFPAWQEDMDLQELAERAVLGGQCGILKSFAATGKIDLHGHDDYFLLMAAERGHVEIVAWLLEQGASPDARNGDIVTEAARAGHFEIVKMLDAAGADFALCGAEALDAAAAGGHDAIVAWLLSTKNKECKKALDAALVSAAEGGKTSCAILLLQAGASATAGNGEAFLGAISRGHFGVALVLLDHGADINAQDGMALRRAAYAGEMETLRFLLAHGADPNARRGKETPLMEAVDGDHQAAVRLLLDHGADPAFQRFLALSKARAEGKRDIAKEIIGGYRRALDSEKRRNAQEFQETFGAAYTLEELRTRKGVSGKSGLLLAAGSGKFAALIGGAAGGGALAPDDLFHPDDSVDMVMTMLVRYKDLPQFFDHTLWKDRHEEVTRAWKMLPEHYKKRVSLNAANAAHDISEIRQKAKRINRLPPR